MLLVDGRRPEQVPEMFGVKVGQHNGKCSKYRKLLMIAGWIKPIKESMVLYYICIYINSFNIMKLSFLKFFILVMLPAVISAQINLDISTDFLNGSPKHSGLPIAVYDIDGDLLDDIVFLEEGTVLHVAYQNWDSEQFSSVLIDTVGRDPQWAMSIADLDKNGYVDIVIGGAYDNIKIYFQDNGSFTKVELNTPDVYVQSLNIVDIDNNGWLDIFLSNDVGYNEVWWNGVTGFRKDDTGLFTDLPQSVSRGNYGAEWIDVEGDGDMDLHVAKCHPDALPTDLRRINRLYINDGLGHFTEEAEARGVASSAQSWTGHFFDSDNDGDFDLVVTNHGQNAQLFVNDGRGYFSDETIDSKLNVFGPVIQSLDADINLDGYADLIIGGVPDFLFLSDSKNGYKEAHDQLGLYDLTSLTWGDLNNDGKSDLFSSVLDLINLPSVLEDRILINRSKGNFLNIFLQDRGSTTMIQDAVVRAYIGDEIMTRVVRSGESYGIQNSSKMMFGLGEREQVDSVVVEWSDGSRTSTSSCLANTYVVFHSSGKVVKQPVSDLPISDTICGKELLELRAPDGAFLYHWSSGPVSRQITVDDSGFYQVDMVYADGTSIRLPGVSVHKNVKFSNEILVEGDTVLCYGESVNLSHPEGLNILWSTGDGSRELEVRSSGWYTGKKLHRCDEGQLDSIYIDLRPNTDNFEVKNDTIKKGENAVLSTSNSNTKWYADSLMPNPSSIGPELVIRNVQKDTQVFCSIYETHVPSQIRVGLPLTDSLFMHSDELNATMIFDVLQPCSLHSVKVWTDIPGSRRVLLYDENVSLLQSRDVELDSGWTELTLDFDLLPSSGRHRLTTDGDYNLDQIGIRSPRLGSTRDVHYPLIAEGMLRIIESQYGRDQFNYFFDWTIAPASKICESRRQKVEVVIEASSASRHPNTYKVDIFPNPSDGNFTITSDTAIKGLIVTDITGQKVKAAILEEGSQDLHVYQCEIKGQGVFLIKWVGGQKRVVIVN